MEKNHFNVKIKQKPRNKKDETVTNIRACAQEHYIIIISKDMLKNWASIERTNGNQNVLSRVLSKN